MFQSEEILKQKIAKNIIFYRELAGDTQAELAEKLNYSDKSISKWERAEGIPGIYVLSCIADLYGITVSDLLAEEPKKPPRRVGGYNRFLITMMSFGLVWLVATFVFIIVKIAAPAFPAWYVYLYAVPANAIVSIVFTVLWWHRSTQFLSISALIWSSIVCLVASVPVHNMNLFYIFAGVFQVLVILWFMMRKNK
jgi:transcriptional regulator with XRE-family HTH domain